MAGFISSLMVRIGADTATLQGDMGKANAIVARETRRLEQAFNGVSGASRNVGRATSQSFNRSARAVKGFNVEVEQSYGLMTKLAAAGGAAFVGARVVGSVVDATNKMIGYQQALQAATGSAEGAARAMAFVEEQTDRVGVSLAAGAQSFAKLTAAAQGTTLTTGDLRDIFIGINEAARVLNLSGEDVAGAFRAIEQTISKGKVQAEELRGQLGERIPGAFQVAAQAMGMTSAELSKQMALGNIYADDLIPKMVKRLHELYGAQAEVAAQTPQAQIERFKNALFEFKNAIGEAGVIGAVAEGAEAGAAALSAIAKHLDAIKVAAVAAGAALATKFVAGLKAASDENAVARITAARAVRRAAQEERIVLLRAVRKQKEALHVAEVKGQLDTQRTRKLRAGLAVTTNQLIAAEERLALATTATAEARAASATVGARVATAGSRIGRGALALVGGGAGLAVAGVTAAVYGGIKAFDAYHDKIEEVGKALASSAKETSSFAERVIAARDAIDQFNKTGTSDVSSADIKKTGIESAKRLADAQQRLIDLQSELKDNTKDVTLSAIAQNGVLGNIGTVIKRTLSPAYEVLMQKIEATKSEIELLERAANVDWEQAFNVRLAEIAAGRIDSAFSQLVAKFLDTKDAMPTVDDADAFFDEVNTKYKELTGNVESYTEKAKKYRDAVLGSAEFQSGMGADDASVESLQRQVEIRRKLNEGVQRAIELDAALAAQSGGGGGGGANDAARKAAEAAERRAEAYDKLNQQLVKQQELLSGLSPVQIAYNDAIRQAAEQTQAYIEAGVARADAEMVLYNASLLAGEQRAQTNDALRAQADIVRRLQEEIGNTAGWQSMTRAQQIVTRVVEEAKRAYDEAAKAKNKYLKSRESVIARAREMGKVLAAEDIVAQFDQPSMFEGMISDIELLEEVIEKAKKGMEGFADVDISKLEDAISGIKMQMAQDFLGVTAEALRGIQKLTDEGSRSYQNLQVAIDAITLAEAVLAVIHAATSGDPYTAIARMAAVAAAIASLGVSIGGLSGGSGSSAEARQETQGTGTVLGDAEAKSESIANAVEITANATEKLVAINTSMLRAMQDLQASIGAAVVSIAQGGMDVDFSRPNYQTAFLGSIDKPLGEAGDLLGLFHGEVETLDTGLQILGGSITDLMDGLIAKAYETVSISQGLIGDLFGGGPDIDENTSAISDDLNKQMQLILGSLVETVEEAAKALGIPLDDIERRIAEFEVAAQKISLEGLTGEEKQAEIAAVFSAIFDNLAAAVVPFVNQFQKVGEGLGETLVRIATEVQVFQEGIRQLGLAVGELGPERFAQVADGMIQAAGGIDAFITGMQSFLANFATDDFKLANATETLNMAFENAGLVVPETRDAMWALLQSLDATTEQGQEQIATLLRLSTVADEYYKLLEKVAEAQYDYAEAVAGLQAELGRNGLGQQILQIAKWSMDTRKQLDDLAKAAGRAGAEEKDLALVHQVAVQRMQQAIAALYQQSQDLVDRLYGTSDAATNASSAVGSFGNAMSTAANKAKEAIDLLLGNLSPFSDRKKLDIALQGQIAGTVTPQQVLEIGRRLFASGADYRDLFDRVMAIGDRTGSGAAGATGSMNRGIEKMAEETLTKAERYGLADQLANNIADLSYAQQISFEDVADKLGLDLSKLGDDLGLDNKALQEYLTVLASDNFGLMDLEGVLSSQVDRLISAITGHPVSVNNISPLPDGSTAPDGGTATLAPLAPVELHRDDRREEAQAESVALRQEVVVLRETVAELLEGIRNNTGRGATATQTLAETIDDSNLVQRTGARRVFVGAER